MSNNNTLTLYLSLTSSPSTPRVSLTLENNNGTTAAELLRKASDATSVPLASMKLIFRGRVIPDKSKGDVVKEFKLENESVVHVMGKPVNKLAAGGGGVASAASSSAVNGSVTAAGASVTLSSGANNTSASNNASSPLMTALTKMRSSNDGSTYRTALTTADKLLGNIVSHPMEEKYRTIKKSNPAFTKRLGGVNGGSDLMSAAGFTVEAKEKDEYYVLMPNADAWPRLVKAREEVQRVLGESDRSGASAQTAFVPPAPVGATGSALPGGMANLFPGGMPGGGMPGGGPGDMAMMQSMMSDPSAMQNVMSMMNNPMVQNMMRNDPRMANNPMLQQSLNALQSNPEMISQITQMMGDPNVRDRMSNLMSQQQQQPGGAAGGGTDPFINGPDEMRRQMEQFQQMSQQFGGSSGGFNAGGGGSGTAAGRSGTSGVGGAGANSTTNASGVGGNGGNDSEMTEEEMIAEAIARSLRES